MKSDVMNCHHIITARKRSLGQGNIFTPVCHSVHRGGVHGLGGMHGCWGGHAWLPGGMHGFQQVHGCGGHAWLQGACVVVGGVWLWGGVHRI